MNSPTEELSYMPNNPMKLGLGISWKNTILSVAGGYGFDFMRDKKKGKTESLDLQYHHYDRKFLFDFYAQHYKGFYMQNENKPGSEIELCPDLLFQQLGLSAYYILNNKRFSYKAAYVHNEKQVRSAGSILLGGGIYWTRIKSDGSFFFDESNNLSNFQFGIDAGYAYNWVINKSWFINGSITGGIHFGSEKISTFGKEKLRVYPSAFPRLSVVYDQQKWALAFAFVGNTTFPAFYEEDNITLLSGMFRLSYIRRIDDFPFLSKVMKGLRLEK
ncbi:MULTISPECIES: DUF4421 family protein [unclassified Parabacteroides]|uniref:DUF4421 family protein n=1 Tax=unclassified Parabacteroides TaxID=2649774 RepID=UPI0024758A5A|nr:MULTISPECIES: DUF4421 family protein [unclassified Parabacteroides]